MLAFEGTLDYLIEAVFTWPSLGDAYKYAAYDGLEELYGPYPGSNNHQLPEPGRDHGHQLSHYQLMR